MARLVSLQSFEKQRDVAKFCLLYRTRTATNMNGQRLNFFFELNLASNILFRDSANNEISR